MHSLQAHRLLWFACFFLTGVVLAIAAYPIYLDVHSHTINAPDPIPFIQWSSVGVLMSLLLSATLTAWVSLWRTLRPRHPEIQLPEPPLPDPGQ